MGKTAVFVISTLQMLDLDKNNKNVQVIVIAHTRELAYQIHREYIRFTTAMPDVKIAVFIGGVSINEDREVLATHPSIVVGTPGRLCELIRKKELNTSGVKHFVVDECDHIIESQKMRGQMQDIFMACKCDKQVMMFTATLPDRVKEICRKYMVDVSE